MNKMSSRLFAALCLLFCILPLYADSAVSLTYGESGNYMLVEKTDLRRYDNGKYTGLMSREVQSFIAEEKREGNTRYYDGNFFVVIETKHNRRVVMDGVRTAIDSSFKITGSGELVMIKDNGYPSFRSFPSYPEKKINIGDSWQAQGERAVDPLNDGTVTRMPILVEYTYVRDDVYNGRDVYVLSAKWATRYGLSFVDSEGDPNLSSASGKHDALIIISKEGGHALVIKDTVDETFVYADGHQVELKGNIALFTKYPPSYNTNAVRSAAERQKIASADKPNSRTETGNGAGGTTGAGNGTSGKKKSDTGTGKTGKGNTGSAQTPGKSTPEPIDADTTVEDSEKGVKLVMRNLLFKPDSAELLPGENERLDSIAQVLKSAPEAQYLVEGHTADTGNPSGEQQLSEQRAKAIAEALAARGIPASQFICKGCGSRKPVASNLTRAGMAQNRRVEITILK